MAAVAIVIPVTVVAAVLELVSVSGKRCCWMLYVNFLTTHLKKTTNIKRLILHTVILTGIAPEGKHN